MKKKDFYGLKLFFELILIFGIVFGLCFLSALIANTHYEKKELEMWNNGYCTCGGQWVYEQAVGHKYETGFIYHCDNCNNYIEVNERY